MNDASHNRAVAQNRDIAAAEPRSYPLGHSHEELRRLERQAAFFGDLTEDVLRRAGVVPGMRVLDVGCGVGDVSLLAGRMVGRSGAVLGIDRSADAIETARRRAAEGAQDRVRFAAAELDALSPQETFDAVIGRLILMYVPDRVATLRRLCGHLRPGGIVAFQEMAIPLARSVPDGPHFSPVHHVDHEHARTCRIRSRHGRQAVRNLSGRGSAGAAHDFCRTR